MKTWFPSLLPSKSFEVTRWTFLFTVFIIGPSLILAIGIRQK